MDYRIFNLRTDVNACDCTVCYYHFFWWHEPFDCLHGRRRRVWKITMHARVLACRFSTVFIIWGQGCLAHRGLLEMIFFYSCIVAMRFLPRIQVAFPGESWRRQSRATQPTVHVGCFSVSIIHRTLTCTTGSLTCTHMSMHAIAHGGCTDTVRESALKVDFGRKIHCRSGESNLPQLGPSCWILLSWWVI